MAKLKDRGCILVDTTCGSVLNVWKNVERYSKEGVTAIVHGKYTHEETRATISQVTKYPQGKYLVVKDIPETHIVCEFIRKGGDRTTFLEHFRNSVSKDFDPERDLARIGLANQTTMMSSESLEIQKLLRAAVVDRYGEVRDRPPLHRLRHDLLGDAGPAGHAERPAPLHEARPRPGGRRLQQLEHGTPGRAGIGEGPHVPR
jgi:4-hydroxy-3-methylbut-2-enyl diphosphate reductase IspH